MFWGKKDKDKQSKKAAPSREAVHARAVENMRAARAHIGEDTLDKIAAAMTAKQRSATEQAKQKIQQADPDKVLDELLMMMKERHS